MTWFPVGPNGGDARAFGGDPKDHNHLFLGTATGWIYQTHDGGATWTHLARLGQRDDLIIDNIVVDSSNPQHLLVGAWVVDHPDGGMFISRDGGTTWKEVKDMAGQSIRSLAQAPSDPAILVAGSLDGVFRSSDGGEHWAQISEAGSKEIHEVESVAIDPKDPKVIYAGTWHLPWKTTDGGEHWHSIKEGVLVDSDVFSIIVDPATPSTVYASACSGIYKSENAGELFQQVQGIPTASHRTRVLLQDPKNAQVVFAGTTGGLYRTGDGGAIWTAMTDKDVIVNDISIDPDDSNRVLIATDRGGVLASKDGGSSFVPSNTGFSARQVTSLVADALDPAVMYAGIVNDKQWGGVFQSRNGGVSWENRSAGLGGRDVFGLAQASDGAILAGTNQGMYRWKDDNWVESSVLLPPPDATKDGSPKPLASSAPKRAAAKAARDGKQVAKKSAPPAKKKIEPPANFEGRVFFVAAGSDAVFAATSEGLLRSQDSGATWAKVELNGDASTVADWRSLSVVQHALFVANPGHLAVSFDDGKNWKMLAVPAELTGVVAIALDDSGGMWVGGREGLVMSDNQGDTWSRVPGFTFNNINSIVFDAANKRMLVTSGSTLAYSVNVGDRKVHLWESGWDLRFVKPAGDHLIAATLFDGLVLQPRMVVSPVVKSGY